MCFTAFATDESGGCGSGLTWTYNDATKTLTISGNGAMNDYGTNINNAPWYSYHSQITKVILEEGITKIGAGAFYYCSALTKVTVPNSVETIGASAFRSCTGLISAELGSGLQSIGNYAFYNNSAFASVNIPDSVQSIGERAFSNTKLSNVEIGKGVITIGGHAFSGCPLTELILGESVEVIGTYAFSECKLAQLTLPASVESIGTYAFNKCKLVTVTRHNKVSTIGEGAFRNQNNQSSYIISHVYYYGTEAEWNNIVIGQYNEPLTGAQFHFGGAHTHSYTSAVTKAATCSETGVRTYTCACGDSYTETIAIDPANHVNTTNVGANASTCTVHGYSAGVYCNDCKQYISGHQQQPLAAHRTELRNARAADCLNAGYTGDEFCSVCQQTISYGHSENALGHTAPNADGNCTRCGAHIKDVEPTPQPEPKLNFFQRIIQWFRNLFARLFGR